MKQILVQKLKTNEGILFLIFIVIFALMSYLSPGRFLRVFNLQSMAFQLPEFGLLALSMTMVIISGGINLSVTYTATLAMVIGGLAMANLTAAGTAPLIAITVGIALMFVIAFACGALNGITVAYLGITPMIATLGSSIFFEGIGLNITRGGSITGFPRAFMGIGNASFGGVPIPMIIFIVVAVALYFILERSSFGSAVYMIGSNPKVAQYSGLKVKRILFGTYVIASLIAVVSAVIMASRYNSARTDYGFSYLLPAVAASVLGGTSITGGEGKIIGTIIAVMIIQALSTGLNIYGVNRHLTNMTMGAILLLVLTIKYFANRRTMANN